MDEEIMKQALVPPTLDLSVAFRLESIKDLQSMETKMVGLYNVDKLREKPKEC